MTNLEMNELAYVNAIVLARAKLEAEKKKNVNPELIDLYERIYDAARKQYLLIFYYKKIPNSGIRI